MTVETKCWAVEVDDGKIDLLMKAYNEACWHCIHSSDPEALKVKLSLETALVAMGLLENEEEQEDEQDEPWDEDKARETRSLDTGGK